MLDIILENFLNVIGIIFLFLITDGIINMLVEDLTKYEDEWFDKQYKALIIKGFFICLIIGLVASFALGKPLCEEIDYAFQTCITYDYDSSFDPTIIQKVGVFTTFFSYTFIVVIIAASKSKKIYLRNKFNSKR